MIDSGKTKREVAVEMDADWLDHVLQLPEGSEVASAKWGSVRRGVHRPSVMSGGSCAKPNPPEILSGSLSKTPIAPERRRGMPRLAWIRGKKATKPPNAPRPGSSAGDAVGSG
jgi:hypothetical protein